MTNSSKAVLNNIYILFFAFSALLLLYLSTFSIKSSGLVELVFWIALAIVTDYKTIVLNKYNQSTAVSMSTPVHLCSIIVLGTYKSTWVVIVATILVELMSRKSLKKIFFNAGQYGICVFLGGTIFYSLKLSSPSVTFGVVDLPAALLSSFTYLLLNLIFISGIVSLISQIKFTHCFTSESKTVFIYSYTMLPLSIVMAFIYHPSQPYMLLFLFPPILMADQNLRSYFSIQQETQETLKLVADIIDKRDSYTYSHSMRVSEYARKIATKMDLPEESVYEIEMAGQVHDLGKVAIEDDILRKTGRLTDEEFNQIKRHPEVGYELLKNLKHYRNGAKFVFYHHERLDGKGYPLGLSDKDIPLGAKILAVADSYDAMTSDRPYRKALPLSTAVEELRKYSGTQFDVKVVTAFIHVLKESYGYDEE